MLLRMNTGKRVRSTGLCIEIMLLRTNTGKRVHSTGLCIEIMLLRTNTGKRVRSTGVFIEIMLLRTNTGKRVRSTGLCIEIKLRAEKCVQNGTRKFFICMCFCLPRVFMILQMHQYTLVSYSMCHCSLQNS